MDPHLYTGDRFQSIEAIQLRPGREVMLRRVWCLDPPSVACFRATARSGKPSVGHDFHFVTGSEQQLA